MKEILDKIKQNDIVIYGNIRYCNDFKYVFQSVFDIRFDTTVYVQDLKCITDELQKLCEQYQFIIACIDKAAWDGIKNCIPQSAKVVWMEELFELLDERSAGWFDIENPSDECYRIPENKKVALWGINDACDFFLQHQNNIVPECIFDRDLSKSGTYRGIRVMSPDSVENWNDYYVIIMCRDRYSVRDWLLSKGMKEKEDFLFYGYYIDRLCASEMMRITVYAPSKRKIDCVYPFSCARLEADGSMSICACEHIIVGNFCSKKQKSVGIRLQRLLFD